MLETKLYTFVEHITAYKSKTLFVCITSDIEMAGKLCISYSGKNPWNMPCVGCKFTSRYNYL